MFKPKSQSPFLNLVPIQSSPNRTITPSPNFWVKLTNTRSFYPTQIILEMRVDVSQSGKIPIHYKSSYLYNSIKTKCKLPFTSFKKAQSWKVSLSLLRNSLTIRPNQEIDLSGGPKMHSTWSEDWFCLKENVKLIINLCLQANEYWYFMQAFDP